MSLDIQKNTNISTRTIISDINIEIDIEKVFTTLPFNQRISDYPCMIVAMYHKNLSKGDMSVFQQKKCGNSFRNAVNLIVRIDDKLINIKVSRHGNFQVTGCKNKNHCYLSIRYFIELCLSVCPNAILQKGRNINIYFYTVMTNIVFNVNFNIDKKKLNSLIQKHDNFYNLFETNFGYTGMNIKLPLGENWNEFKIPYYTYSVVDKLWNDEMIEYQRKQTNAKQKFNTFLVFHSGKIIMSGMCEENMNEHFSFFRKFIQDNREEIEEQII